MERASSLVAMSSASSPLTAHVSTMAAHHAARSENLFGAQQPPSTMVSRAGSPVLSSTLAAAQARQLAVLALPSSRELGASLLPVASQDGPSLARVAPYQLASTTSALSSSVLGGAGRSALPVSGHSAPAGSALGSSLALSTSFGGTARHSTLDLAASSMRQAEPDQRKSTGGKGLIEKIVKDHHLQRSGTMPGGTEATSSRGDSTNVTDAATQLRADDEGDHSGKRKRVVEELAAAVAPPLHDRGGGEEAEPFAKRQQTEPPCQGNTESAQLRGLPLPCSATPAAAPLQASSYIPGMLHAALQPQMLQQLPYHFSVHPAPAVTSNAAHATMLAGTLPHHLLHQSGASSDQSTLAQSTSREQPPLLQASQPAPAALPLATLSQPAAHSTVPSHWPPTPAFSAEATVPSASAKELPSTETPPPDKKS